jgi:hypothetical protein
MGGGIGTDWAAGIGGETGLSDALMWGRGAVSPRTCPETGGPLRSFVTAFFSFKLPWMAPRRALLSPVGIGAAMGAIDGGGAIGTVGGGGGATAGGAGGGGAGLVPKCWLLQTEVLQEVRYYQITALQWHHGGTLMRRFRHRCCPHLVLFLRPNRHRGQALCYNF